MDFESVHISSSPTTGDATAAFGCWPWPRLPTLSAQTLAQAQARTDQDRRDPLAARTRFLGTTTDDHDLGTVGVIAENSAAHLISTWVVPAARGTGVADRLVHSAIDRASPAATR